MQSDSHDGFDNSLLDERSTAYQGRRRVAQLGISVWSGRVAFGRGIWLSDLTIWHSDDLHLVECFDEPTDGQRFLVELPMLDSPVDYLPDAHSNVRSIYRLDAD